MQSKAQLKRLFERYDLNVTLMSNNQDTLKYKLEIKSKTSPVSKIVAKSTLCRHKDEDSWNMGDAVANVRGLGKLLYYCSMDFVYPDFVRSDMCGCSNLAIRVWKALEKVDYVETKFEGSPKWELNPDNNDNYSTIRCRFKW